MEAAYNVIRNEVQLQQRKGVNTIKKIYHIVSPLYEKEWDIIQKNEKDTLCEKFNPRSWKQSVIRRFIDGELFPRGGDRSQDQHENREKHTLS